MEKKAAYGIMGRIDSRKMYNIIRGGERTGFVAREDRRDGLGGIRVALWEDL
jgi:hypothetical protein